MTARPAALWAERPSSTWYNSSIWKKRAKRQLRADPLCAVCLAETPERVTVAVIADHCRPWRTRGEFCFGPLRSVCHEHNMVGPFQYRGHALDADPTTGFPRDRRHPFWRGSLG
jgi:hypothetical protein